METVDFQTLETLVNEGRIREAREMLAQLRDRLAVWEEALALPVTRSVSGSTTHGDTTANGTWLREHWREYPGKWVALRDGNLVDHDESRISLHNRLAEKNLLGEVTFVRTGRID